MKAKKVVFCNGRGNVYFSPVREIQYRDLKTKLDLKNLTAHDRKKNVTKSLVYATSAI